MAAECSYLLLILKDIILSLLLLFIFSFEKYFHSENQFMVDVFSIFFFFSFCLSFETGEKYIRR